jgi:Flp pilus assembly protein TadB
VARVVDETEAGKGRATPSRKEAEAARKQRLKTPTSRKDQAKREREMRDSMRTRQREALKTGEEKFLPARERGPVRRFARDYVDRRRNVAEFLLIFLVVVLVFGFFASATGQPWAAYIATLAYPLIIVLVIVDEFLLLRGLRRELKARFSPDETGGTSGYAILRTMQLRRMRLPKPQIKRGAPLRDRY